MGAETSDERIDVLSNAWEIRGRFGQHGFHRAMGERFASAYVATPADERSDLLVRIFEAASHADHVFRENAFLRSGDMAPWFDLEHMDLDRMGALYARTAGEWREDENARTALMSIEEIDLEEAREEDEEERISGLEQEGFYGRTHRYERVCDDWIFVRFGRMPKEMRSAFGLAGEATEDGPDEWRVASGNMTHESGICVLRAYRHPDVTDAYVLMEPDFGNALYHVSGGFESYLNSIVPRTDEGEALQVLRLDGSLKTCVGPDGTRRIDLGSDGEYMIDGFKPTEIVPLSLDQVWIAPDLSVRELLIRRRGIDYGSSEPTPAPGF